MSWEGDIPSGFEAAIVPARGMTNHHRCMNFSRRVNEYFKKEGHDLVIGFNKMQGLDIYYAADPCYKAKVTEGKGSLYCIGPRARSYMTLEKAVFDPSSKTRILLISDKEKAKYILYYGTPEGRFHSLPPGISRDRAITDNAEEIRKNVRNELGVRGDEILLLMVGRPLRQKGLTGLFSH
jgi:UDP-glucose:(heptosyl)LPS alpha-1,3-glucosyltransferase